MAPGAPASETTSAGHAYQLQHLTNGQANQAAELGLKEARFRAASSSQLTIQADTSRRAVNSKTHQEGGNYARFTMDYQPVRRTLQPPSHVA
jgi:hypothetical protein